MDVKFLKGLEENLPSSEERKSDSPSFYYTTDTEKIFLGHLLLNSASALINGTGENSLKQIVLEGDDECIAEGTYAIALLEGAKAYAANTFAAGRNAKVYATRGIVIGGVACQVGHEGMIEDTSLRSGTNVSGVFAGYENKILCGSGNTIFGGWRNIFGIQKEDGTYIGPGNSIGSGYYNTIEGGSENFVQGAYNKLKGVSLVVFGGKNGQTGSGNNVGWTDYNGTYNTLSALVNGQKHYVGIDENGNKFGDEVHCIFVSGTANKVSSSNSATIGYQLYNDKAYSLIIGKWGPKTVGNNLFAIADGGGDGGRKFIFSVSPDLTKIDTSIDVKNTLKVDTGATQLTGTLKVTGDIQGNAAASFGGQVSANNGIVVYNGLDVKATTKDESGKYGNKITGLATIGGLQAYDAFETFNTAGAVLLTTKNGQIEIPRAGLKVVGNINHTMGSSTFHQAFKLCQANYSTTAFELNTAGTVLKIGSSTAGRETDTTIEGKSLTVKANTIFQGVLQSVGIPQDTLDVVNKQYLDELYPLELDEKYLKKREATAWGELPFIDGTGSMALSVSGTHTDNDGKIPWYVHKNNTSALNIDSDWCLGTGTPTQDYAAANKKYVDDKLINLEKLVEGLTDAQIQALNDFAKSLTVTQ